MHRRFICAAAASVGSVGIFGGGGGGGRAIPPGGPASVRGKGTGRGREGAPVYQPHHRPRRPLSAGHSTLASWRDGDGGGEPAWKGWRSDRRGGDWGLVFLHGQLWQGRR